MLLPCFEAGDAYGKITRYMSSEVTRLLDAVRDGTPGAWDALLPLVYEELRRLASRRLSAEAAGHTLQATELVNEVYLRLIEVDGKPRDYKNRKHFFAAAGEAMRRVLIEHARRKNAQKRKGSGRPVPIAADAVATIGDSTEILALHEAFLRLEQEEPEVAEVVRLRFFAGMTGEQVAEVLGQSARQVDRYWSYARVWLYRALRSNREP